MFPARNFSRIMLRRWPHPRMVLRRPSGPQGLVAPSPDGAEGPVPLWPSGGQRPRRAVGAAAQGGRAHTIQVGWVTLVTLVIGEGAGRTPFR